MFCDIIFSNAYFDFFNIFRTKMRFCITDFYNILSDASYSFYDLWFINFLKKEFNMLMNDATFWKHFQLLFRYISVLYIKTFEQSVSLHLQLPVKICKIENVYLKSNYKVPVATIKFSLFNAPISGVTFILFIQKHFLLGFALLHVKHAVPRLPPT